MDRGLAGQAGAGLSSLSRNPYGNNINSMLANYTRNPLHPGANVGGVNSGLGNVGGNVSLSGLGPTGVSPSSSLQRSALSIDPLASPGTSSMGIPASPRSFSSSNLTGLPGSAGMGASSLPRQVGGSLSRLEQQEHQMQAQSTGNSQQHVQSSAQHELSQGQPNSQPGHPLGNGGQLNNHQVLSGTGLGAGHQLQSLGIGAGQQLQPSQNLSSMSIDSQTDSHSSLLIPKAEVKQEEDLQHQVALQRTEALLSPQLQRQDVYQMQQRPQQQQQSQQMINLYQQQQRLMQQQHLQQSLPQHIQRSHIQSQQQQQQQQVLQQQQHANLIQSAGPSKQLTETSVCARRLMSYMYHQRHRPQDNNISFWRKFVAEYFGPKAKKRWCVSLYGNGGRQPTGVFPQDVWHCEICGTKPARGFETTMEVLPRLCKIKYDSGILEELLYVDLPHEYKLSSGLMVLEYGKAIQESVFEALRVVRDGQLRIIFSADLKILSWEFCAKSHEELLPRRLIVPQVTQLATIAQKYQTSSSQTGGLSMQDMQTNCHLFVTSARQLARNLEVPTVNDLGYTKRYVRCLQISEVVNSMKDLIDFSRENDMGPRASLLNFPRRSAVSNGQGNQALQQQQQEHLALHMADQNVSTLSALQNANTLSALQQQLAAGSSNHGGSNISPSVNGSLHTNNPLGSFSNLHPSSLGSLQSSSNSLGSSLQPPSSLQASPTSTISSFQPSLTTLSGALQPSNVNTFSNSVPQGNLNSTANLLQQQSSMQTAQSVQHESQNSVHHLLQEMMMNPQMNGGNFQQSLGGSSGGNLGGNAGLGAGVSGLSTLSGSGTLAHGSAGMGGNSNGVLSPHLGGNSNTLGGGVGGSLSPTMGGAVNSISGLGNNLRNVGGLSSIGAMNALNGRLHLTGGNQQNNLQMQDQGLHHDIGGNTMLGSLGASGGYGGLQYNWKSP